MHWSLILPFETEHGCGDVILCNSLTPRDNNMVRSSGVRFYLQWIFFAILTFEPGKNIHAYRDDMR